MSIMVLISDRGGGDWPPVVALAAGLHQRGHTVCMLCDASTASAIRSTGLPTISVPPELEQSVYIHPRWVQELLVRGQGLGPETPNPLVGWAQACAPFMRSAMLERKPTVFLSSLFCMGLAALWASEMQVPWCFVNPSFYFGENSTRPWDADFLGLSARMFRYWLLPLAQQATTVLHATDTHFDLQPTDLPPHHHYVGPLIWEPRTGHMPYLDEPGLPWALVTLSTGPQEGELAIARAALQALADQPVRTLVTLAPGHARTALGTIPENARVSDYVPHGSVLKRACLVISHAGHGIVMKALYYGVPMVLVPWGRDQPGVAARAARLGVATVVPRDECSVARVTQAVSHVRTDARYQETAEHIASRLQSEDTVARACAYVEALLASTA